MKQFTHASLFSGIGGPEVAAAMLGWRNAFHCEINPFGRAVLEYWFPDSISYADITKTQFTECRGKIDVLTGGFPCQPFSYAGKRAGANDDRYLWPQMLRVIDEIRPTWVVGENVAGIATMVEGGVLSDLGGEGTLFTEDNDIHLYELEETYTIERICKDLEQVGYSVQPVLIPAASVGAPHRRDRIFIIAHVADRANARIESVRERENETYPNGYTPDTTSEQSSGSCPNIKTGGKEQGQYRRSSGKDDRKESFTDSDCKGRQEPLQPERKTHQQKEGTGLDDRAERLGGNEITPNAYGDRSGKIHEYLQPKLADGAEPIGVGRKRTITGSSWAKERKDLMPEKRWRDFPTVSPVHRGNDGLPFNVDDLTISAAKWREESLKAYGNAIVPQVMYEIFKAIELIEKKDKK